MKEKTYEMLEKALQEKISLINNEGGVEEGKEIVSEIKTLSDILTNIDKVEYENRDKSERRKMEELKINDEIFDKSERRKFEEKKLNEEIIDRKETIRIDEERVKMEIEDKSERRRIEEEKNKENAQIEREKQDLTWKKIGIEMAKTFGPLALSMFGYNIFQKRIIKFEETGRLITTASRELHLPKFFK